MWFFAGFPSSAVRVTERVQRSGPADHDVVAYQLEIEQLEATFKWQPAPVLVTREEDEEVKPAEWEAHLGAVHSEYEAALAAQGV